MKLALSIIGSVVLTLVAYTITVDNVHAGHQPRGTTYNIIMSDSTPNYGQTVTFNLSPAHPNPGSIEISVKCTQNQGGREAEVVLNEDTAPGGTLTFTNYDWIPGLPASCRASADVDGDDNNDRFNSRRFTVAP